MNSALNSRFDLQWCGGSELVYLHEPSEALSLAIDPSLTAQKQPFSSSATLAGNGDVLERPIDAVTNTINQWFWCGEKHPTALTQGYSVISVFSLAGTNKQQQLK
ncbi:hypothetical protein OH492_12740 [Vibrio chagasii]|nr:hypothetical protein [Vibrio chagasii]